MTRKRLSESINDESVFTVIAELTGGPGYNFSPIKDFLNKYSTSEQNMPEGFEFSGIALPQNPGGIANIDPSDVISQIISTGIRADLDIIPHISCKDANSDAITSSLVGYRANGIESVLALTGDKPVSAQGVFELESVTLLSLIRRINRDQILKATPGKWQEVHQFFTGAAVSPFKYTEASLMQQYYKMEKKISCGAEFLITQVGWDWKKSAELMSYLRDNEINIPVIGNVYVLTTSTPAPRLMYSGKLPGCFVSDELFSKLKSESHDQQIARAAQQVAMYKSIGAAGVDIGGVHDYQEMMKIIKMADEIGDNWQEFKDNLCFPPTRAFYLYDEAGNRAALSRPRKKFSQRTFNFMHRAILDPDHAGFSVFRSIMKLTGAQKGRGFAYRCFNSMEKAIKYTMFDCQECGDCYLPENFGYCTLGGCEKGLANAPCGDATVDGMCGNNTESQCKGELVYLAAAAQLNGRDKLRETINIARNPKLKHTSSILNYLFGKDHTMGNALISIGESVHASIPKTGRVMAELIEMGPDAYTKPSKPLEYIRALIEGQADEGADYIAINVDAFGESDPQLAVELMIEYVKLVRKWGKGVPACMDSSDDNVLRAGLREWYNSSQAVGIPLINSIKVHTMDDMMPLRNEYEFSFIGLLVSEGKAAGPGGSHSVDELYGMARQIFDKAVNEYGFKPEEIFFDSTVFPLAIDMPMEPGVPGYTYRAFETIKKIKSDQKMKGVHCSLGVSNCCRDLPGRRIGICRAYVAKAMEYGLDAGIVNVNHHYGRVDPDPGLLKLVNAFAGMDGAPEKTNESMMLMGKFCADNRK